MHHLDAQIEAQQNVNWMKNILIFQRQITEMMNIWDPVTLCLEFPILLLPSKPRTGFQGKKMGGASLMAQW